MELYLIRHGQSFNNALVDGGERVCDPPLTETGETQARLVARHVAEACGETGLQNGTGFGITRLFCSPMLRTLQTAVPIARALGCAAEVWPDVHEEGGIWLDDGQGPQGHPGLGRREMETRFAEVSVPETISEAGWWNRPKEIEVEWRIRALRAAAAVRERFAGTEERVAIVTHGGFANDFLHALIHGGPMEGVYFSHFNTAISRIDFPEDGRVRVRSLNRVGHLPAELVT